MNSVSSPYPLLAASVTLITPQSVTSAGVPNSEMFSLVSDGVTCSSELLSQERNGWAVQEGHHLSHCDLTPHSKYATHPGAKQMLSSWKRCACFHPLQSACRDGGKEVRSEKQKEPSRVHSSTPSCQKNCNCSVYSQRCQRAFHALDLHIDNTREKKERLGYFFSLHFLIKCHQRTVICDLWLRQMKALQTWLEEILVIPKRCCRGLFSKRWYKICLFKYNTCCQLTGFVVPLPL